MSTYFQKNHIFRILSDLPHQPLPLDLFLSRYFRAHKSAGAKDRRVICEAIYGMTRWKMLLDTLVPPSTTFEERLSFFQTFNPAHYTAQQQIPPHIRVSFPEELFKLLCHAYGEEKALALCLTCNETAPTTVRVNTTKISRVQLFEKWKEHYAVSLCTYSSSGIIFEKKINFFALDEFKEGLFEIQDEGSQLVSESMHVKPGDLILDYCAGSGGKTLAFHARTENRGQIFMHDVRPRALAEAKKRCKRAGIQNAQFLLQGNSQLEKLHKRMDWTLVDVPCSGTGTLRRNPDQKWKFELSMLERLVEQQRDIFAKALEFLSPNGKIAYATCSILPQENQEQVNYFLSHFPVTLDCEPFFTLPKTRGMDGFFAATFRKKA